MNRCKRSAIFLFLMIGCACSSYAQEDPKKRGDLSALLFGDYYWFISNHNPNIEGNNGFWIRRIYLTYDYRISDSFSARVRLEMQGSGDFTTDSDLIPAVKDAWLKYTFGQHAVIAGIASTPTWDLIEAVWGYRSVAKSPLDLQDMGNSRGLGIAIKGKLGASQRLGYHFMISNGNGEGTELNQGKKMMLALSYELTDHLIVQAYGDYETRPGNSYTYTLQGFIGYQSKTFNLGGLFAHQFRNDIATSGDVQLNMASLFTNFDIAANLRGFLRVDHMFDANPLGEEISYIPFSSEAPSTFVVGGVDIQLHPKVSLQPNVEAVFYGENELGASPDSDLIARMTLFVTL